MRRAQPERMTDSRRCLTMRAYLLWWRLTAPVGALALRLVAGFPHVAA